MTNAKKEFIDRIANLGKKIKCAIVVKSRYEDGAYLVDNNGKVNSKAVFNALAGTLKDELNIEAVALLQEGYAEDEFNEFLDALDYDYDSGYGTQEVFGAVWMEDGSWWTRSEYDGAERWKRNVLPAIPKCCKSSN